jgi:hypothetical protein
MYSTTAIAPDASILHFVAIKSFRTALMGEFMAPLEGISLFDYTNALLEIVPNCMHVNCSLSRLNYGINT